MPQIRYEFFDIPLFRHGEAGEFCGLYASGVADIEYTPTRQPNWNVVGIQLELDPLPPHTGRKLVNIPQSSRWWNELELALNIEANDAIVDQINEVVPYRDPNREHALTARELFGRVWS